MKNFFLLKLFLVCNYMCVAHQYDYKPKFKAIIHSNRYFFSGCPMISRPVSIAPLISYQVTSRPTPSLLDYKFIFSTLRFMPKNKNLIERLEQFKSILKQCNNGTIGMLKFNSSIALVHEAQLSSLSQNKAAQEISERNCIQISGSAKNFNIGTASVNVPQENWQKDNTMFLKKISADELEEIHSGWSLKSTKELVCTYTDQGGYKDDKPTINLEDQINAAFGGENQAKELGFNFRNARVCFDKNNNNCIAVQFTFLDKRNNIIAFLDMSKKKLQASLKNLYCFQDITGQQKLINVAESDPRFSQVCYTMNSGLQHVECSSNHSIMHYKFLIRCIVDSQKLHKKPKLWNDKLVSFLQSYSNPSPNKQISSKEQFEKSCSDCARCNKKIDWFKPYINSKNSCTNTERPCALFSFGDCFTINYINQVITLFKYFEDISSLRCAPNYVQRLAEIMPDKLKRLIPENAWQLGVYRPGKFHGSNCLECRKFFEQQIDKICSDLDSTFGKVIDDFSVISSLRNKDGSYPTLPEQIAQKIEDEYLIKYLNLYGYKNHKAAKFYTLLGYNSQYEFIDASSKDVVDKIRNIREQKHLASDTNKSKFLREMENQARNLVSKRFLDAYLKYTAGNTFAFDNFTLTKSQSDVIQEIFKEILYMKFHISRQQAFLPQNMYI